MGWIAGGENGSERGRPDRTDPRRIAGLCRCQGHQRPWLPQGDCALRCSTPSPALRGPRQPSAAARWSTGRWQTPACPAAPRSQTEAGPCSEPQPPRLCKAAARAPALGTLPRAGQDREGGRAPGVSHPDSRCTPSARARACPAWIERTRWRLVSSGCPPSLAFPLGPALGGGGVEGTSRGPTQGRGVMWRARCYLPEGLRARWVFPSSPVGGTWQGLGSRGGGALSRRRRASSAAPHGFRAPRRLPRARAVNTRAIVKQTLTWAGGC